MTLSELKKVLKNASDSSDKIESIDRSLKVANRIACLVELRSIGAVTPKDQASGISEILRGEGVKVDVDWFLT